MATSNSLWGGIVAAVVGIAVSIILFIAVALPSEQVVSEFETVTISSSGTLYDIPAPWNMGYDDTAFWMSMMYIIIISPALLGIIIMFVSAIKTQEYDVFEDGEEYAGNYGGQAVPQYISAEEIAFRRQL